MKDSGMYKAAAKMLREGCADVAAVTFMLNHDGLEEGEWFIVYDE